jgi:hypothetical protein
MRTGRKAGVDLLSPFFISLPLFSPFAFSVDRSSGSERNHPPAPPVTKENACEESALRVRSRGASSFGAQGILRMRLRGISYL